MSFLARIGRVTRLTIISAVLGSLGLPLAALQVAHAAPPVDLAPPSCALTRVIAGPPKQFQITVQDTFSGLNSISLVDSTNDATSVPPFVVGTTNVVVVTMTKIDPANPFTLTLRVTDVANNVTTCNFGDDAAHDTTRPSCALTSVIAGPPKQMQVTVQDTESGLRSIVVVDAPNTSTSVPPFSVGTPDPVVVVSTKIDQAADFSLTLRVTDVAGNVTTCSFSDSTGSGGNSGGTGGNSGGTGGLPGATPELDSLLLMASGLSGLGGYTLLRLRSRRRR